MDARELRIGNYFIGPNGIEQVLRLNSTMVNSYGEDEITGIPLNEEWLVKMGFIRIRDYPVYSLNDFRIELNLVESKWKADLYVNKTVILYVHQLQNLVFALTGEELTIK
jgi:hypothetical protein